MKYKKVIKRGYKKKLNKRRKKYSSYKVARGGIRM